MSPPTPSAPPTAALGPFPADLESLLRPLEEFEALRHRVVALGDRLCDLSYANPYGTVAERTIDVLRRALASDRALHLQYSPFGGQTLVRRAVADDLRARRGADFTFADIVLTPGAMAALHVAMRICGEPGDEIVIPTPCWLDYPLYARVLGLVPVAVPLEAGAFDLDPQVIARALTPRTCAVLLANPSNPTGRAYDAERFSALAAVLGGAARRSGRPITLIADEAHRDFVPADRFVPAERHWPATLVIYSFGKYHLLQGQRIGYLAVAPGHPHRDTARREAVRSVRALGFCTPTALMQAAVPALLGLRHDLAEVDTWRTRFMAELRGAGYRVAPADGTLFLYVEAPGGDDLAFARVLAARGLLVLPAAVFHHRGWFRVSLTGDARMLEGALRVLREARAA